jgi:predicted O-linked N-acetylglucosamine transferase (SPINDLY family)
MLNQSILNAEKLHFAGFLETIQRCVYSLVTSSSKLTWPLTKEQLETQKKNVALFEALAASSERFAKLQYTLGAAMRHVCNLAHDYEIKCAEIADHFNSLKTLISLIYMSAVRLLSYCQETFDIEPKQADFSAESMVIVKIEQAYENEVIK